MPKAICEDCGSMVEAELTHNGICAVGHYVHCGWGHELTIEGFISDDIVKLITRLEAKLTDAADVIEWALICWDDHNKHGYNMQGDWVSDARTTLAALTGSTTVKDYLTPEDEKQSQEWKCPIDYPGCRKNCGSYGCGN